MQPKDELTIRAAQLARSAPEQWRGLVEALGKYNEVRRENLVRSPLNELPVNQGRAQEAKAILDVFANCLNNAGKIEGRAK